MPRSLEPAPCPWRFWSSAEEISAAVGDEELVAIGADLEPGTLLTAYRSGVFPMPLDDEIGWWSPEPRGIIPLDGLRVSRSLRKSCQRYSTTINLAFADVIEGCADLRRKGAWIEPKIREAYLRLHQMGWAHSVEVWSSDGELAGGLYGVAIGGLFAGESMFHRHTDASKVALVALVEAMREQAGARLLDVQWLTPHLASLGGVAVSRFTYHSLLSEALRTPPLEALTAS